MSENLVEVKLKDEFEREKFVGLCGFFISKGETKMIAVEDYQAQSEALELVKPIIEKKAPITGKDKIPEDKEPEEPEKEERKLEPEEDFNLEKEVGDVVDEAKDLFSKVRRHGQKKSKK